MSLSPGILKEIDIIVRGGFAQRDEIVAFLEEKHEPGELDETELTDAVDAAIEKLEMEKHSWPVVTDCDRLCAALTESNREA